MKTNRILLLTLSLLSAASIAGCPSVNTPVPETISAASNAPSSTSGAEAAQDKKGEGQMIYETQSAVIDEILEDWRKSRSESLELPTSSTFSYSALYNSVSGTVLYRENSERTESDLTIQLTIQRNHVKQLGGGPREAMICEWHRRDGLEYASVRTDSKNTGPLREFMCRDLGLSVRYVPVTQDDSDPALTDVKPPWAELEDMVPDMEFIKLEEQYYRIDRENNVCLPISDTINSNSRYDHTGVFFSWLQSMADQSEAAMKMADITIEDVERALPEGYLLGLWDKGEYYNYAVADANRDGYDDILAEIRPVKPTVSADERSSFSADNVYRKVDSYYALQLWLLEGRPDGGYTPRRLEEDIVWDENYSYFMGKAYYGGFSKEYFVGRSPFEEFQFYYEYDEASDSYRLARSCRTYSYDPVLRGRYMIEDEKNFGQLSLPPLASDTDETRELYSLEPWTLEKDMEEAYPFYYCSVGGTPSFTDPRQAAAIKELVQEDLNGIVTALKTLEEMKDPFMTSECTFMNSNILVISYYISDNVSVAWDKEGAYKERMFYRMYDLRANQRIPIQDVISFPELMKLALSDNIPIDHLLEQYVHLEDPLYELSAQNSPMSVFLTQEGLGILTCETGVTPYRPYDDYQRNLSLIPREYLLDMTVSSLWDDIPKKE